MKKLISVIAVLLAFLLMFGCAPTELPTQAPTQAPTETPAPEQQSDVLLTFLAVSDTHIGDKYTKESMESILGYASSFDIPPEVYLFAGDLTDTTGSTKSAVQVNTFRSIYEKYGDPDQMLYCLGPTHDTPSASDAVEFRQIYRDALGEDYFKDDITDTETALKGLRHRIINGFHFFMVDWEGGNNGNLERDTLKQLRTMVEEASNEDKNKPIFVLTHVPGVLDSFLRRYPQVVCLTGHVHNSVAREDSISQDGGFTSLHCGGVNYYRVDGYNRFYDDPFLELGDIYNFAQGLYVQVDKDHNVTIKRLDGINKAVIGEEWTVGPGRYDVYKKDRKNTAEKLTFGRYAKLKVEEIGTSSLKVSFDNATAGGAGPALYYSVELLAKSGGTYKVAQKKDLGSRQVFYPNDEGIPSLNYSCTFTGAELSDYAVVVTAYDCWNKSANALVYTNGSYSHDSPAGEIEHVKHESQSSPESGEIIPVAQKISFNYTSDTKTSNYTKDYSMAVRFCPNYQFTDVYLRCSSWGDTVGTLDFTLYKWDTDYQTTIKGDAVDTHSMSGYKGSTVYTVLDGAYEAGEYLLVITTPNYAEGVGLYHYGLASGENKGYISYENGKEMSTQLYFGWTNTATCEHPYKIYP